MLKAVLNEAWKLAPFRVAVVHRGTKQPEMQNKKGRLYNFLRIFLIHNRILLDKDSYAKKVLRAISIILLKVVCLSFALV